MYFIAKTHQMRNKKENEQQKEFFCPFEGCDKVYESQASLGRHRTKEKHHARDLSEPQKRNANKKKTAKPKKTKKSHQTISDMLRQVGLYSFCSRELSYLFNFPKDFVEGHQRNVFKTIQYYFKKIFPSSPLYDSIWLAQLFVAQLGYSLHIRTSTIVIYSFDTLFIHKLFIIISILYLQDSR